VTCAAAVKVLGDLPFYRLLMLARAGGFRTSRGLFADDVNVMAGSPVHHSRTSLPAAFATNICASLMSRV
jgi:hypothetical protein